MAAANNFSSSSQIKPACPRCRRNDNVYNALSTVNKIIYTGRSQLADYGHGRSSVIDDFCDSGVIQHSYVDHSGNYIGYLDPAPAAAYAVRLDGAGYVGKRTQHCFFRDSSSSSYVCIHQH